MGVSFIQRSQGRRTTMADADCLLFLALRYGILPRRDRQTSISMEVIAHGSSYDPLFQGFLYRSAASWLLDCRGECGRYLQSAKPYFPCHRLAYRRTGN